MKASTKPVLMAAAALIGLGLLTACGSDGDAGSQNASASASAEQKTATPSEVLASTPWETTGAKDASGQDVALDDENVKNFVGWAYFDADGTFTMYNLDDSPKMQGDWTVDPGGEARTIVAKDADGKVLFTRKTDIVALTGDEFTYRVFPDEQDTSVYFDIVHTPTDHAEPATQR